VNACCVQGLTGSLGGVGNIGSDPLFLDRDGIDGIVGTRDDDVRLGALSPLIDGGNNAEVAPDAADLDQDLVTSEPTPLDLLAHARFVDDPNTADTGSGVAPLVDIGALEFEIDCNGNSVPDTTDIAAATSLDCNQNGVPDECDIADGFSADADDNSIPDECSVGTPFCFGDGSGAACPCDNTSTPGGGRGCAHSLGQGARIAATGAASVSNDTIVLSGSGMPASFALYFQGTLQQSAGLGAPFGDGLRCAAGAVLRLGTAMNSGGGASSYPGAGEPRVTVKGQVPAAGGTRHYQVWYRNAAAFCTSSTFNLSNGLELIWVL